MCYQNQIVPTQEAPPRPGVLRTLNATRGLGSVTVENLAAGMDTNGIGGHEREGQKWLRKSEQGDKWNRCLIEGMIVLSETGARDEQTTPT